MVIGQRPRGEPGRMVFLDQSRMTRLRSLYDSHAPLVYSLSLRLLGDAAAAEHATATVFVAVARHLEQLPESASFDLWLKHLTADVALRYFRKKAPLSQTRAHAEVAESGRSLNVLKPDAPALEAAIRILPLDWRFVFVLHDIEGFSQEDIATLLGWAVGTVKATVTAARMRLRQALLTGREPESPMIGHDGV